jgi:uncharacterized membrane protein (DUF4010 family)
MLALAGGVLYLFDPSRFIPFTGGLLVLGAWLAVYYRAYVGAVDEQGEPNVGIVVPLLNIHAYLLGAVALALPPWVAVAMTVVAVLLLTGREQLHDLARRVEIKEIVTAGQFLVLTGIVLPLLPNQPVTTLTPITPRQVWLALVVVCTFSYASYLAQRHWAAAAGRPLDGRARWALFLDSHHRGAGPPGESPADAAAASASRHHARNRDHVSAHSGDRSHLSI